MPPMLGAVIAQRYLLGPLIGHGAMGAVYAGRHIVTGKQVAIKLLRDDATRNAAPGLRMAREARAAGRVNHPNVVTVYDAGLDAGRPFIVMELLQGESLAQRIDKVGPLSESLAVDILRQVACGVEAAHASGIIHRDLKPANIVLCPAEDGHREIAKVLDFGISKMQDDDAEDVTVTSSGAPIGTPAFMSPEQVRGEPLDERTDVYALTVMLYYMLAQRYPFQARSHAEMFVNILTADPIPLSTHRPETTPALWKVLAKGLARERALRYESVTALVDAVANSSAVPRRARWRPRLSRTLYLVAAVSSFVLPALPTPTMHAAALKQDARSEPVIALPVAAMAALRAVDIPESTEKPVSEPPMAALEAPPQRKNAAHPRKPRRASAATDAQRPRDAAPMPLSSDANLPPIKLMSW
ncbi:MAG: protein kinase [Polyangiales bacterium]